MLLEKLWLGQPWDTIIFILWALFMLIVPYNCWYAFFNNGEFPIIEYIKEKLRYNFNNHRNNK